MDIYLQDQTSVSGSLYLHWVSNGSKQAEEKENPLKNWTSSIIEYCQRMVEIQKSSLPRSQSEETFLRGNNLVFP